MFRKKYKTSKRLKKLLHTECLNTLKNWIFLGMCMIFAGCSTSSSDLEQWMSPNGKVKVLSTTAMIDDIVRQVGGDRVDHIPLIVGEIDPHSYELVKGDDEKLAFAQIIFYNGLGLEHGASLRYVLAHHPSSIALGDAFQREAPELILHVGKDVDPHIWMDISSWKYIVNPIADALAGIDPEGKEIYYKNADIVKCRMQEEHEAIKKALAVIPKCKRYLVTSHDAFNYFTRAYLKAQEEENLSDWQDRFDAPEGLSPESQLSIADIQKIVDHLMRYQIKTVFPESNLSPDSLKKIIHACGQMGLDVEMSKEVLYGDAMGCRGSGAEDYLTMIRHNAEVMIKEWQKEK